MNRIFCLVLITFLATIAKAQDTDAYWKRWNENYPLKDANDVLKSEYKYARDVEASPEIAQYYVRKDAFRFKVTYLGKIKPIDAEVKNSMKKVLLLTKLDESVVDKLCENAVLVSIGNNQVWMPIQKQVLTALEDEIKKDDKLMVYCLFLNEHNLKKELYNTFLISEFTKL